MQAKKHWDDIYSKHLETAHSWYQAYPKTSMDFMASFGLALNANIIDIGGGDSNFVDVLIESGYQNIWVLDISELAIQNAKKRLGAKASKVNWVIADVNDFVAPVHFDLWHDRAAFHFFTVEDTISKYVSIAKAAINTNGFLLLGTFSENGPEKCSGLFVKQYSETSMAARFNKGFKKIKCVTENHITPFDTIQNFLFCIFKKKSGNYS